MSAPKLFCFFK